MSKVTRSTELRFTTPNRVGIVAGITRAIADTKTNIVAMTSWSDGTKGYFKMFTSDNTKAATVIKTLGYKVEKGNILLVEVPNKPAAFQPISQKIATAGVNINYCYGTTTGPKALLVLSTNNDTKTMNVIRQG